ncbi:MAG: hypothetical protein ACI4QT_07475 [Kiritimatiellia bacterium]
MNDESNFNTIHDRSVTSESQELDASEIPETDIVFECPHCGKSLSIDQRGAGLPIRCTQCQELISVPVPEGMELDDLDAPPEELSAQLFHTRQMLAKANARLEVLEAEVVKLRAFRDEAKRMMADNAESARILAKMFQNGFASLDSVAHNFKKVEEVVETIVESTLSGIDE